MCERDMSVVRAWILVRYASEGRRLNLSSNKPAEDSQQPPPRYDQLPINVDHN